MRYLGLLPFTFVMWMLVWGAGVSSNMREAQRTGKKASGTSGPLAGFLLGWILTIVAYFWDHRDFWGTFPTTWTLRLTPYGFWAVFGLHAVLGAAALSFCVYDNLQYRKEERRRGPGPSHQGQETRWSYCGLALFDDQHIVLQECANLPNKAPHCSLRLAVVRG